MLSSVDLVKVDKHEVKESPLLPLTASRRLNLSKGKWDIVSFTVPAFTSLSSQQDWILVYKIVCMMRVNISNAGKVWNMIKLPSKE